MQRERDGQSTDPGGQQAAEQLADALAQQRGVVPTQESIVDFQESLFDRDGQRII